MLMHACNHGIRRRNLTLASFVGFGWGMIHHSTYGNSCIIPWQENVIRWSSWRTRVERTRSRCMDEIATGFGGRLRAADDYSWWLGFLGWRHAAEGMWLWEDFVVWCAVLSFGKCFWDRHDTTLSIKREVWINFYLETDAKVWDIHVLRVYVKYILLHSIQLLSLFMNHVELTIKIDHINGAIRIKGLR